MNPLAGTPVPAHADSIGSGAREVRWGINSRLLLVCLIRVVSVVFSVCLVFWSLWFLCFAERRLPDKQNKSERQSGLSDLFRSVNHTDSVE
jgi:hypothetical protein